MASLAVQNTVTSILAANWSYTDVYGPNAAGSVPSDNRAFLEILFPVSNEQQYSFGAPTNYHEETGAFRVVLNIPAGIGIDPSGAPWTTRIEALMQQFRGKFINSTEFLGFVGPTILDDSDDGAYFEISFACSYRHMLLA
ncbi:MAG: hypothetical protein ACR652_00470 [Methylocystis sp.]|uniref:hypothetical protein n=1 Tax=Methylocystis sp. TaxID=1911079 RepID=UPI003DA39F2A